MGQTLMTDFTVNNSLSKSVTVKLQFYNRSTKLPGWAAGCTC